MPTVSILIPCYNAEQWIQEAIQSALNQTHQDCEVIVVDDGSVDDSLQIIESFGNSIRYEAGENKGGNAARNRLLHLANGEWLQFLDADDYLEASKIEHQLERAMAIPGADVIYSPVTVETWRDGAVVDRTPTTMNVEETIPQQWLRWKIGQTGAMLWKRRSLESIGGWNEDFPCCQDNEVTLRALQNGLVFAFRDSAEAVYRVWSDDTVCHRDPARVISVRFSLMSQFAEWLKANGLWDQDTSNVAGEVVLELARTIAQKSIPDACDFLKKQSLARPKPSKQAYPGTYVAVYQALGFRVAEHVASLTRKLRQRK